MSSSNNKRIAKNTAMLYIRMLLTMAVSLYTSRIILNTLGVEDFGIYNVVGGFVTMFGFLNSAMASATQRFLSFEIGKKDFKQLRNVFSMSINIHLLIAFIILILAETIGLWFLNTQLTIPPERLIAAKWVYQFSILTLIATVLNVPYNAAIIAHERMNIFAWVSIIEVSLKLLIVFMLQWFDFDKLKFYAVLIFSISLTIRLIYGVYYKKRIDNTKHSFYWDSSLFKQLFSHSGWMLFGTSTNMLSTQGVNILINVFFGVTVNAARGIAVQIQAVILNFINNFMTAVQPQIIKSYAQQNEKEMYRLIFSSSKMSFFLLFMISLPILLLTETVLSIWLKIVPEHAVIFTRLTIIDLFFVSLFPTIAAVSQATGKIKNYQLIISIGFFFVFILAYSLFKLGLPSYFAFVSMIIMSFLGLLARLYILYKQISFPIKKYYNKVLLRLLFVLITAVPIPLAFRLIIEEQILQFLLVGISAIATTTTAIWKIGLDKSEKHFITQIVKQKFKRYDNH